MSRILTNQAGPEEPPLSEPLSSESWLALVQRQVASLHFGVVQIVVHNSRVTQIDRTERVRLDPALPQKH